MGRKSTKIDEVGNRYHYLTVIAPADERDSNGAYRWICHCDCGNTTTVSRSNLVRGKVKSCGCVPVGRKAIDLTGRRFGRLLVLRACGREWGTRAYKWECRCDCGNVIHVRGTALRTQRSCGCFSVTSHKARYGRDLNAERKIWKEMIRRCHNPKDTAYGYYGARGIAVCDRWRASFEDFVSDMGPRPANGLSIDRINNDKGYCPENCRWATTVEQARNTRHNHRITIAGETKSLVEWSLLSGIKAHTILARLKRGRSPEHAVFDPVRHFSILPKRS